MDCNCPSSTSLTDITTPDCGVNLNQVQRLGYQRHGFQFDSGNAQDILELATWQALMTATDDTKIVVSPLIGGDPVITPGEAITSGGGDNSTLNGVEEVDGVNPSSFACLFKSLPSITEKEMKELNCEKNLVVYLFLQGGLIACVEVTADTIQEGFHTQSVFTSDRGNDGFGSKDYVNHSFQLAPGWSDNLVVINPNFNPLTDL